MHNSGSQLGSDFSYSCAAVYTTSTDVRRATRGPSATAEPVVMPRLFASGRTESVACRVDERGGGERAAEFIQRSLWEREAISANAHRSFISQPQQRSTAGRASNASRRPTDAVSECSRSEVTENAGPRGNGGPRTIKNRQI